MKPLDKTKLKSTLPGNQTTNQLTYILPATTQDKQRNPIFYQPQTIRPHIGRKYIFNNAKGEYETELKYNFFFAKSYIYT